MRKDLKEVVELATHMQAGSFQAEGRARELGAFLTCVRSRKEAGETGA